MIEATCSRICSCVRDHKAAVRILLFLLALALVVFQASNIEDFIVGFLEGFSAAGQRH